MKSPILIALIISVAAFLPSVKGAENLIIETKFDQQGNGEELSTVDAPDSEAALPLKAPTRVEAHEPSSILAGTESLGELKPPYARVELRSDTSGDGSNTSAAASIKWDLQKLLLPPGRYAVRFELTILEIDGDGGNFLITFCNDGGEVYGGHPIGSRVSFIISKGMIGVPDRRIPANPNTPYQVEMIVDTTSHTMATVLDGDPIQDEVPFQQDILSQVEGGCRIAGFEYVSTAGMDNSQAKKTTLAIRNVTMVRVP